MQKGRTTICDHTLVGHLKPLVLEPVQDIDQWMQRKAKVDEKAQHTGVCEHFASTFNTASPQSAIQRDLEQALNHQCQPH